MFWLNEECPKILGSLGIDHPRRKTIPLWNSSGENEFFRASLYVWYQQYWALCDALVDFRLWAWVRYLSFSIDTAPECILWKRSREDRSLRASRDGHSSSSSISLTLLVFRHLLQVQRAVVLNFLYLVNLKFRVRAPNGCCILYILFYSIHSRNIPKIYEQVFIVMVNFMRHRWNNQNK